MVKRVTICMLVIFSLFFWQGSCFAGNPIMDPKKVPPKVGPWIHPGIPKGRENLTLPPSIKTDLRWNLVRYVGPSSWEAIVRITATFTNVGSRRAQCPDAPCRAVLRTYDGAYTPPSWLRVLGYRNITTLASGQRITITKDIKVSCSREFPNVIEALHDVNFDHPDYYVYHDPDYLWPSNADDIYDYDRSDNVKRINERDIMNALWDGCRPKLR